MPKTSLQGKFIWSKQKDIEDIIRTCHMIKKS